MAASTILLGKFLSADPLIQDPMNGQSYNRYAYVLNNPTNLTDPTGFAGCKTTGSNIESARNCVDGESGSLKNYVMNNSDGSRTEFSGGKQVLKTDGKGTVLFDAKAPQANANAIAPPAPGGDITKGPPPTSNSFGVRAKFQEGIDNFVAQDESSILRRTVGAGATAVNQVLNPDNPVEAAVIIAGPVAKIGSKLGTLGAATEALVASELSAAATRAAQQVGPGRGSVYGTRVHSAFEVEVNALGKGNIHTEVSYLNGQIVPYGTKGSVRLDVVNGPVNAPISVYDLKTGGATLTQARIQQIQSHISNGRFVPVSEIRP